MKKILRLVLILACVLMAPLLFLGCSADSAVSNDVNTYPITKEIGNYIIDIEYTKFYNNSLITKYYITTKDGSNISDSNITVVINDIDDIIDYGISPSTISTENVSNNKLVVIEEFFIAMKNSNFININYELGGNDLRNFSDKEKTIEGSYYINESSDGYEYIHNEFSLGGFNFTIQNFTNLDFGSILQFYITDTESDRNDRQSDEILNDYCLKLKLGEYSKTYEIKRLIAYTGEDLVNDLALSGNYDINMKYISFFQGNLIYDSNNVNINDMQVYLVNKITGEETLIYSN